MTAVCGKSTKNQWIKLGPGDMPEGEATEMMLDTDLCLAYDIPKGSAGETCCAWQLSAGTRPELCHEVREDCGSITELAGTAGSDVNEFANDEAVWLREFQTAWTKATTIGSHGLQS